jgi:hypothetical protein
LDPEGQSHRRRLWDTDSCLTVHFMPFRTAVASTALRESLDPVNHTVWPSLCNTFVNEKGDGERETMGLICEEKRTYHDVLHNKGGILFFVPFKLWLYELSN